MTNVFLLAAALVAPAPSATVTTVAPLDRTVQCFRTELGGMGRLVTINTASGALLDFAFDTVAADGRPASARIMFTIDDLGATRTVAAAAEVPGDAPLAAQLLAQTAKSCLPEANAPPQ